MTHSQGGGKALALLGITALILAGSVVGGYNHFKAYTEALATGIPILGSTSFIRNVIVLCVSGVASLTTWALALRTQIGAAYLTGTIAVAVLALGEVAGLAQDLSRNTGTAHMIVWPNLLGIALLSTIAAIFVQRWRRGRGEAERWR